MTRFSLTSLLLRTVSHGAQEHYLHSRLLAFEIDAAYINSAVYPSSKIGFMARIWMWLQLLWGQYDLVFKSNYAICGAAPNRHYARKRRRKLPAARQATAISLMILRQKGLKKCQQWLYNRTLVGRVRWCFTGQWRWASRQNLSSCMGLSLGVSHCGAPLCPD